MNFTPQNITTSLHGIQHSHGKGIFVIVKRSKYSYHHPKPPATDHRLSPATVTVRCRQTPPPATVRHSCHYRPASYHPLIKGIFENLLNILGNSICIPNTPKISYLRKLFPEIAFLEILFSTIKIHFVYQTPF